jgi:hypothetical protein
MNDHFTCDAFDDTLADLLEGTAAAGARAQAEAHAARCARCLALLSDLIALRDEAAALPVYAPTRDLWGGISAAIERKSIRRLRIRRVASLGAAAVVVFATANMLVRSRSSVEPDGANATVASVEAASDSIASTLARVETAYDADVAELNAVVANQIAYVDTATVRVIESGLQEIDDAIEATRAALVTSPDNALLSRQLARAYELKLATLRQVAALTME